VLGIIAIFLGNTGLITLINPQEMEGRFRGFNHEAAFEISI
jgi:hypothetical protein